MSKEFSHQACIVVPGKLCKQVSMLKLLIVIDLLCTLPLISIVTHRALDLLNSARSLIDFVSSILPAACLLFLLQFRSPIR